MEFALRDRPIVEFNHHSPDFACNWRTIVAKVHRTGPVVWTHAHGGHWIIADRDLVEQTGQDWQTFSSRNIVDAGPGAPRGILIPPLAQPLALNEMDSPDSTNRRMLEAKFFTPKYVRKWMDYAEAFLDEAIDAVLAKGGGDFVHDLGLVVPAKTALAVVGIDAGDWLSFVMPAHNVAKLPANSLDYPYEALGMLHQKLVDLINERGDDPRDDMASSFATAKLDGEPLDPQIGAGMLLTLVTGGFDTATAMLSHSFIWLADHKNLWPALLADETKMLNAIDELLRVFPSNVGTARNVMRDIEFGGQLLRKGERVMTCWAGANYDPKTFPDPEDVRLDRPNASRHLTFGAGGHRCLGSPLARAEIKAMLRGIMTKMPDYRVDKSGIEYFTSIGNVNGVSRLPFTTT